MKNKKQQSHLSDVALRTVAQLHQIGMTPAVIAKKTNIPYQTIHGITSGKNYAKRFTTAMESVKTTKTVKTVKPVKTVELPKQGTELNARTKLRVEDVLKAMDMLSDGTHVSDVSKKYGVSMTMMANISRGHSRIDVTGFEKGCHNILTLAKLSDDDKNSIKDFIREGIPANEVAESYKISTKLVTDIVGNMKVTIMKRTKVNPTIIQTSDDVREALKIISDKLTDLDHNIIEAKTLQNTIASSTINGDVSKDIMEQLNNVIAKNETERKSISSILN